MTSMKLYLSPDGTEFPEVFKSKISSISQPVHIWHCLCSIISHHEDKWEYKREVYPQFSLHIGDMKYKQRLKVAKDKN